MRFCLLIIACMFSTPLLAYFGQDAVIEGLRYRTWILVDEACALPLDESRLDAFDPAIEGSALPKPFITFRGCHGVRFDVEVDKAGLYAFVNNGFIDRLLLLKNGRLVPLNTFFENDTLVADLHLEPGTYRIYGYGKPIGIRNANRWGIANVPYRVAVSREYHRSSFLVGAVRGICFGILSIMAIFFLFMTRENNRVFLIYGSFITLNILFIESIRSLTAELLGFRGGQHYFEDWNLLTQTFGSLTQLVLGIFLANFYEIKRLHPRLYRFFRIMYGVILLQIPVIIFKIPFGHVYTSGTIMLGGLTLIATAIYYSIKRGGVDHLILVGYAVMMTGTEYFVLTALGVVQADGVWGRDVHLLGSTVETILFSIATSTKLNNKFAQQKKENDHVISQLEKIVYPHQLKRIREGSTLEETMPTGKAEACVLAFDIIGSSRIQHDRVKDFIERAVELCVSTMYERYDAERLAADAYRIKVVGDGFLCSVGFPFGTPDAGNIADAAVHLALKMVQTFDQVEREFNYHEPIHCAIGIAHGSIEAYYPQMGTREYDLYGSAIVLATRYEQMRKALFAQENDDYIILQERVFEALSPELKAAFSVIELSERQVKVRDDEHAQRVFVWKNADAQKRQIVA